MSNTPAAPEPRHSRCAREPSAGSRRRGAVGRPQRRKILQAALGAVATAALLAGSLSACGSSSNEAVVQVAGAQPITKALIAHWIPIEAVLSYSVTPVEPVPAGVVPDPPKYSKCMAFLKAHPTVAESGEGTLSPAKLKTHCQQKEEKLRKKVIVYMIAYRWLKGELALRHLSLTPSELNKAIRFFETYDFTPAEFHKYLLHSKETREDLRIITEINAMGTKLQERALFKKGTPEQLQRRELADMVRRWSAKTSCKAGYVVAGCKEYHGSETPL